MAYQSKFKGTQVETILSNAEKIIVDIVVDNYDNFGSIIKNLSSLSPAYEIMKL